MNTILHPNYPITPEEFNRRYWKLGHSLREIATDLGGWGGELRRHALNAGLSTRTRQQASELRMIAGGGRTHDFDQDFFKTWMPESAWVLGLIASDGCIPSHEHCVEITMNDLDCLEQAAELIGYDGPFRKAPHSRCHILQLSSTLMVRDLLAIGIGPRKSLTLRFPAMPIEMQRHFVRGYFDGDGSLSIYTSRSVNSSLQYARVALCTSSLAFAEELSRILADNAVANTLDTRSVANQPAHKLIKMTAAHYRVRLSPGSAKAFFEYIYDGVPENLGLRRKRKQFQGWYDEHASAYQGGKAKMGPPPKPRKPCSVSYCSQPHHALGMCIKHYSQQWYRERKGLPHQLPLV